MTPMLTASSDHVEAFRTVTAPLASVTVSFARWMSQTQLHPGVSTSTEDGVAVPHGMLSDVMNAIVGRPAEAL